MLSFIKRNLFIIIIFLLTIFLSFITFLTFINKSFIELNEQNLQLVLIVNIIFLLLFFVLIFIDIKNSIRNNINVRGSVANRKYIISFGLFTLIPSLLIAIFSLFIFSFALEKYFDKKITTAVNNSYEIAKNYVDEKRNKIQSEIVLIAFDLNKYYNIYKSDPERFKAFLNTQNLIRDIDQLYLINSAGELIISANDFKYIKIEDKAIQMVKSDDRPLKIINAPENRSAAVIRLQNFEDTFLYVVKSLDKNISNYLLESEEAVNFYYTVENQSLGIRISFAIIYISLVTLLLFLSITIAIRFSSRFFISINNLITASEKIGEGNLDAKVPELKADREMELLNKNFNSMIEKLKNQQDKLLSNERHEAWSNLARKLAHEIKNPLGGIRGAAQLLNDELSDSQKEYTNIIIEETDRLKHYVDSMVGPSQEPNKESTNIHKIINHVLNLMASDSRVQTSLIKDFDPSIPEINIDKEMLTQALINVIKNAIEASDNKGKVLIRTRIGLKQNAIMKAIIEIIDVKKFDNPKYEIYDWSSHLCKVKVQKISKNKKSKKSEEKIENNEQNIIEELKKLTDLYNLGVLTNEEFQKAKNKIFNKY